MSASTRYIAHLTCQHCNTVSPKDTSTRLYNKVYEEESGLDAIVEKGSIIEIDLEDIESSFIQINKPITNKVRCAEIWSCPTCKNQNFAELVFLLRSNDAVIEDIKSVELTSDYLSQLNYLAEWIDEWARYFTDTPVFSSLKPSEEEIKKFREFLVRLQEEKKE